MIVMKEKQKILLQYAEKHLGKPYKYGAKNYYAPKIFDCSSFVQYLYRRIGVELPRTALQQAHYGKRIKADLNNLQIGDLIFFRGTVGHYSKEFLNGVGHVMMYIGDGNIIHAKSSAKKVIKEKVILKLKKKDLVVIKRIL